MTRDVNEMKNVSTAKSQADVCGGDHGVHRMCILYIINQSKKKYRNYRWSRIKRTKNRSKNIINHGIKESMEIPISLGKVIRGFFNVHYGMLDVNIYGAHQVGKQNMNRCNEACNCTLNSQLNKKKDNTRRWLGIPHR